MTGRLRVGIVGIGFGQQVHLPIFRAHPQCEVAGLCASTYARAAAAAAQHKVPHAFGSWPALIDSADIDVVSVAAPPVLQPEIIRAALAKGKPVFCEKPVGCSAGPVAELAELAQQRRLPNMVDLEFPEIPAWQRAQAILSSGALGQVRHVVVAWNVETYANKLGLESWKTRAEDGGGVLPAFVSHSFYYLEWLLGPIARLSARLSRAPGDTRSAETLGVLGLEFASGCMASLTVSSHAFLGNGHRLEFYGDHGAMILENLAADYARGFTLRCGTRGMGGLETVPVADFPDGVDGRIAAVTPLAARFVDWCLTGRPAAPTL
ncbi:MAG: Gfo/Idh/MocA family oxidoreductase, partial [Anaerolineales bacterium]